MKKQKKSGGKSRRRQGNPQVHQKSGQQAVREGAAQSEKIHESRSREKAAQHPQARRTPGRGDDEQKRRMWDRKQEELAARRAAAEARRAQEDIARRRKATIVWSSTGIGIAALAGALAWHLL